MADFACDQGQINQGEVFVHAHHALIQAHRPHADETFGITDPLSGLYDVRSGNAALFGVFIHRQFKHFGLNVFKTIGVFSDERSVHFALLNEYTRHRIEQVNVGAGDDGQMQIGNGRTLCVPRVSHNDFHIGVRQFMRFNPTEQDRVTPCRVCTCNEKTVRQLNVIVTHGHGILTQ